MKKKFLFLIAVFFFHIISIAQVRSTLTYTQMIDTLMYPLNKSGIATGILYDRVYPFAGLHSFNTLYGNPDTSSYAHFYQAYSEIYNAAYNKSSLMNDYRLDTIAKAVWYSTQIIPIGILCYDLNIIDTNSIAKNFFYRGSDSMLHDVAGRTGNPYLLKTVTVAAALATDTLDYGSGNFQFKYYSGLFFTNKGITITSLVADFGTGAQNITSGGAATINYTSGGTKTVKFTISYSNGQQATTYCKVFVRANAGQTMRYGQPVMPDETRNIADTKYGFQGYDEGIKLYNSGSYGIYYHRTSPGGPIERKIKKPIILVDGFDPKDETSISDIYGIYLQYSASKNFGSDMRDEGYDIIVLNFPTVVAYTISILTPFGTFSFPIYRYEGADYMERNAFLLVTLIESINTEVAGNGSSEKNVVVGPSMGGLITRYALKWMENNSGHNHNTRLWISFDAPHKGANIAIGDQDFFNFFATKAGNKGAQDVLNFKINSVAAKQLLLHHYLATYDQLNSLPAGAPNFRDRWQTTIDNFGYPNNLRKISLINGAINGTLQGQACQTVLNVSSILTVNLFFFKVGLLRVGQASIDFTGSYGNFCQVFDGWAKIWFNTNGRSSAAPASSQSYDIIPGGYYDTQQKIVDQGSGYSPLLGGYSFGVGTDSKFIVTKATHSFIPTFSSLGMDLTNKDLGANLYNRNLVCSGESPFDTYFGPQTNEEHITLESTNVSWLKSEIDQQPQPPTYNYSSTYVMQLVSGREPLCSGSNVYTVTNIPTGGTVTWLAQPAGIALVSYTGNGSQATVSTMTTGSFSLIATLNFCNHPAMAVVSKTIQVGAPSVSASGAPYGSCYNGAQTWNLTATPASGSNWDWEPDYKPANTTMYFRNQYSSTAFVDVTGGGTVKLLYTDACGVSRNAGGPTVYSNCAHRRIHNIAPNPAHNQITVSTISEGNDIKNPQDLIFTIKITDRYGVVRRSLSYKQGVSSAAISVADLNAGTYLVSIFDGQQWSSEKLIVQ